MKKIVFYITIVLTIFIGLGYAKPVFALSINTPKITNIGYVSENEVKLYYYTSNANTSYKVQIKNLTTGKSYVTEVNTTSYNVKDLAFGKTYNFEMRVYYKTLAKTYVSDWSNVVSATPRANAPTISSVVVGDKSLTLNYKVVGSPIGVQIYNYNAKNIVSTTNLTSYTFSGLTNGTKYKFIIRNYYGNNIYGPWANPIEGTPSVPIAITPTSTTITASQAIVNKAKELAWPLGSATKKHKEKGGTPTAAYKNAMDKYIGYSAAKKKKYKYARGVSCSVFVCAVIRASGYDSSWATSVSKANSHAKKSSKWKNVSPSKAIAGDIFSYKNNNHILIYGGKSGTKYIWYQANYGKKSGNGDYGYAFYGKSPSTKKNMYVWHATGTVRK